MNDSPPSHGDLEPYTEDKLIYRAVTLPDRWQKILQGKKPKGEFYRLDKDKLGISVNPHPKYAYKYLTTGKIYGFLKLQVGFLRENGLDAVPDRPDHANIGEVPTRDQDRDEAMRIAELLIEHAEVVTEDELAQLMQESSSAA